MRLTARQYASALVTYLEKNSSSEASAGAFLTVLRKNHQEKLLSRIILIADRIWKDRHGEMDVTVSLPMKLSPEVASHLQKNLVFVFQKKIYLREKIDPKVKGGILLRAGDYLYDATVFGRLTRLRRALSVDD